MIAFLFLTVSAIITLERNVLVVTSMAVFAMVLELLQTFVPGRGVFFIDAVASLLGVLLGIVVTSLAMQFWRRRFDVRWRRSH